jgi:carbon storage regulator
MSLERRPEVLDIPLPLRDSSACVNRQGAGISPIHPFKELAMLVLSRIKGEGLVIGDGIVVEVVEVTSDKVRLGIVCPKDVPVHRQEVWDAIQRSSAAPAPVAPVDGDE